MIVVICHNNSKKKLTFAPEFIILDLLAKQLTHSPKIRGIADTLLYCMFVGH